MKTSKLKGKCAYIVVCQWPRFHTRFKASIVAHPIEFPNLILSTEGFISGDLHSKFEEAKDSVVVYQAHAMKCSSDSPGQELGRYHSYLYSHSISLDTSGKVNLKTWFKDLASTNNR